MPGSLGARVRLGVITNPTALHNHRFPFTHGRLLREIESAADAVATADRSQIDGAVRQLLLERDINVLALNGGDGTIHSAINSIAGLLAEDPGLDGGRLPRLLLLNGGTYNMASRAMGTKGDPVSTVTRFLRRYRGEPLSAVRTREVPLLEVRRPGLPPMLGMIFGSQVVANALELCDRMGSGYLGLARLLWKGVAGHLLGTPFYRENAWRLRPDDCRAWADGVPHEDVTAIVAATVDMKLARGLVWALTTTGGARGFHMKIVRSKSSSELVRLLPHLLWELPHPMILSVPEGHHVKTSGSFTVDGELYDHAGAVDIALSPWRFDVVSGDGL